MLKSFRRISLIFCTGTFWWSAVFADVFSFEANILYYDTVNSESTDEIEFGHEEQLLSLLKDNPEINTLVLNSSGGLVAPANYMADLVIDAGLDTHVEFMCASACVTIFLAGKTRTLGLGGKIGFHKGWWDAGSIEEYYISQKDSKGWATPFDFASWFYEDTQEQIFTEFEYLLERGVSPGFSIKTLKADADGMWYPRRRELLEGGILKY